MKTNIKKIILEYIDFTNEDGIQNSDDIKYLELSSIGMNKDLPIPFECYEESQRLYMIQCEVMHSYIIEMYFKTQEFATTMFWQYKTEIEWKIPCKQWIRSIDLTCYNIRKENNMIVFEFCFIDEQKDLLLRSQQFEGKKDEVSFHLENLQAISEKEKEGRVPDENSQFDTSKFYHFAGIYADNAKKLRTLNLDSVSFTHVEENRYMKFPLSCYPQSQDLYWIMFQNFMENRKQTTIFYFDSYVAFNIYHDTVIAKLIDIQSNARDLYKYFTLVFGGFSCYEMRYYKDIQIFDYCFTGDKVDYKIFTPKHKGKAININEYLPE